MKKLISIILVFLPLVCFGQRHLSLDDCLKLAARNNAAIQSAEMDITKAEQVRNQALTKYFPQVSAVGVGYHSLNPLASVEISDAPSASVRDILNTLYNDFGAALGLQNSLGFMQHGVMANLTAVQPVYMGGKIVSGNKLASVGVEASELKLQMSRRDAMLSAEESYWLVVNLESKKQMVASVTELLDTVSTMVSCAVNAGLAMPNDLLQVQIRQDEIAAKSIQLNNGIVLARRALCQSVGLDESTDFVLDDVETADAVIAFPAVDSSMVASRPEAKLLDLQVDAEKLKRRMTLADALPQIAVGGLYGYNNFLAPFNQSGYNQFIATDQTRYMNGLLGVMVRIPITSWWEMSYKLKQHDASIRQAQIQRRDLDGKMQLQISQAYDKIFESAALENQYRRTVDSTRENFRLSSANYKAGTQTISDLLQAQSLYLQAQSNLTDAILAHRIAVRTYLALSSAGEIS